MDRDLLELSSSLAFVDEIAEKFRDDRASVDPSWAEVLSREPAPAQARGGNGSGNGSKGNGGHAGVAAQAFAQTTYAPPPSVTYAPPTSARSRRAPTVPPPDRENVVTGKRVIGGKVCIV
jgi:hypothetical protein